MDNEMKYKHSKQRDAIMDVLTNTRSHPTAAWIFDQIKTRFKNLSMGTIYRNLNILVEQGKVKRLDAGSTFDRYEANIGDHYHFICEKCGRVIDVDVPFNLSLHDIVGKDIAAEVKSHRMDFYGICAECSHH